MCFQNCIKKENKMNGDLLKWVIRCIFLGVFGWGTWMTNTALNSREEITVLRIGIAHIVETVNKIDVKLDRMDRHGR